MTLMKLSDGSHLCTKCKRVYLAGTWEALPTIGVQHYDYPDGISEDFDLRNCGCGGTMGVTRGEYRRAPIERKGRTS